MPDFYDSIKPSGAYDGSSTVYTLPVSPNPQDNLLLIYDGVALIDGYDFNLVASTITFINLRPKAKDIVRAYFQVTTPPPTDQEINFVSNEVPVGTVDGINTAFSLAQTPVPGSSIMLTLDGVYLTPGLDYNFTAPFSIVFLAPPPPGSILLASYRNLAGTPTQPPPPNRFNSYPKADIIPYIRNYLNDPNGVLWDNTQISRWISQAEQEVLQAISMYWIKFPLALTRGIGTYDMPVNLKGITRMTYRGVPVEMLTQKQVAMLSPVYKTQVSKVLYAYLQFEGYYTLRLFCTPYEDLPILSQGTEIYTDKNLLNEFQIGAWFYTMESDPNFVLPDYIYRRTVRYYVMWKAFSVEGYGQDIEVGAYWRQKFEAQMGRNVQFNGKLYAAKERQLQPQYLNIFRKIARPILPPNFGPVVNPYSS